MFFLSGHKEDQFTCDFPSLHISQSRFYIWFLMPKRTKGWMCSVVWFRLSRRTGQHRLLVCLLRRQYLKSVCVCVCVCDSIPALMYGGEYRKEKRVGDRQKVRRWKNKYIWNLVLSLNCELVSSKFSYQAYISILKRFFFFFLVLLK